MLLLFLLFVILSPGVIFTLPVGKGHILRAVAHSVLFIIVYSLLRSTRIEGFKTEITDTSPNGGYNAQKSNIKSITDTITAAQAAIIAAQNTLDTTKQQADEAVAASQDSLDSSQRELLLAQETLVVAQTALADFCCPTCIPPVPC